MRKEEKVDRKLIDIGEDRQKNRKLIDIGEDRQKNRKLINIGEQTEGERETTCVRGKSGRFHRFLKIKFNLE